MQITHVLKSGAVLEDISGHLVKAGNNAAVYQILKQISTQPERGSENEQKKK